MTVTLLSRLALTNKILVTLHICNVHHLAKKSYWQSWSWDLKVSTSGYMPTNMKKCRCSKRKTKWQLTVMQITSKAMQLNYWQHKTRQCEIFTNTKCWKYGECKHCRPLVKKAGCSWGAKVVFWDRIEFLLATRILAFIFKCCKAIERKAIMYRSNAN